MKPAVLFSCLFLVLVATGHVLRLVFQVPLSVGSVSLPMWPSVITCLVAGGLSLWLWRQEQQPTA